MTIRVSVTSRTFACLFVSACVLDLRPNEDAVIACKDDSTCPRSMRCATALARCVERSSDDTVSPNAQVTIAPARGTIGTVFTLTLVANEPLGGPPQLHLGARTLTGAGAGETFVFTYTADGSEAADLLEVTVADKAGNANTLALGQLPLDIAGPAVSDLTWTDNATQPGPLSVLGFSLRTDSTAQLIAVHLLDASDAPLATLAALETIEAAAKRVDGTVDLSTVSLLGVEAVTVQVTLHDDLGNATLAKLPIRSIDAASPDTSLTGAIPPTGARSVTLTFASNDGTSFLCALDGDLPQPCSSPHLLTLTAVGAHTFTVAARDAAGNVDPTPALASWTYAPYWTHVTLSHSSDYGSGYACALASHGAVYCWGAPGAISHYESATSTPRPFAVDGGFDWRDVTLAADGDGVCLTGSGSLACFGGGPWGDGSDAKLALPTPLLGGPWVSAAMTRTARCLLRDDATLWCMGNAAADPVGMAYPISYRQPQAISPNDGWTAIVAGDRFMCGLRQGRPYCWGSNTNSVLGPGGAQAQPFALAPSGAADWTALSAGNHHVCGLRGSGSLWCWGGNGNGEAGIDPNLSTELDAPTQVGSETDWTAVSTGLAHSCGVRATKAAYCWGNTSSGVLAPTSVIGPSFTPPPFALVQLDASVSWSEVVAGFGFTCGLSSSGALSCWGQNVHGELGGGIADDVPAAPGPPAGQELYSDVSITNSYACALTAASGLRCWGSTSSGADGSREYDYGTPHAVGTATDWRSISTATWHACGIREVTVGQRTAWCWGDDWREALGRGAGDQTSDSPAMVGVSGSTFNDWQSVHAGGSFSVGLRQNSELYFWGQQPWNFTEVNAPVRVGSDADWQNVSAGDGHICGVRAVSGGTLWCYGRNSNGCLGLDDSIDRSAPTQVGVGEAYESGWTAVSAGGDVTCGLRGSGSLWCWGNRVALGLGSGPNTWTPMQIGSATNWISVHVGGFGVCARQSGGGLSCWGGGVGGLAQNAPAPVPVLSGSTWSRVSVATGMCAINATGSLICSGPNGNGVRGDGLAWGPFTVEVP